MILEKLLRKKLKTFLSNTHPVPTMKNYPTDSDYQAIEIFLFHDGSTVYLTQYASIFDNGAQATFDADINSGNVRLLCTPASGDTMAYKFIRTTIEV